MVRPHIATLATAVKRAPVIAARWASSGGSKPKPINDSTSALDYKMHRPSRGQSHGIKAPRVPSAEDAVTNILYNTPPPSTEPYKRHLLNCLVQNEPGVLSRVSGILAGRGFNIDSLVVCQTEIRDLSRMCIVLRGQDGVVEQARRQLEDLVPVWAVLDYTQTRVVERELMLAKVSILGPEFAQEQLSGPAPEESHPTHSPEWNAAIENTAAPPFVSTEGEQSSTQAEDLARREEALARQFEQRGSDLPLYPARKERMTGSEMLIAKNLHLNGIKTIAEYFGGKVVDLAENSCIVELTAESSRVNAFLNLMRPFGVLEASRSGVMVLPRTPIANLAEEDEPTFDTAEEIDLSSLPPG